MGFEISVQIAPLYLFIPAGNGRLSTRLHSVPGGHTRGFTCRCVNLTFHTVAPSEELAQKRWSVIVTNLLVQTSA
jgi:hypothetical protein